MGKGSETEISGRHCPVGQDFERFLTQWNGAVIKMETACNIIDRLGVYFEKLPSCAESISRELGTTNSLLKNMNDNLIKPATSENRVSSKVHLGTVIVLGLIIFVLLTKDTKKSMSLGGPNGVSIGESNDR